MTTYEFINISQQSKTVLVQINRPEKLNALNAILIDELTDIATSLRADPNICAIILTGSDEIFSAGADLDLIQSVSSNADADLLTLRSQVRTGADLCRAWEEIEVITIAAVEGPCVGGACALALACDFRIGSKTATMRLPEVPLGLNMSWQTLPRLTTLIGPARAKRFALFGESIEADTLERWGLLDQCVAKGEALSEAQAWADRISTLPALPVRMTKEAINATANLHHHATSVMDRDQFLLTLFDRQTFKRETD